MMGHSAPKGPSNDLVPNTITFDHGMHKEFLETAQVGAKSLFLHFADYEMVTEDDLFVYFERRIEEGTPLTPYELELKKHVDIVLQLDKTADTRTNAVSEKKIADLIGYINSRNDVLRESRKKLVEFKPNTREMPWLVESAYGKTKSVLGATVQGFVSGTPTEKAMMVGGIAASFYLLRSMYTRMSSGSVGTGLKKLFKAAFGSFLIIGGLTMANKAIERTAGRPLLSKDRKDWLPRSPWVQFSQENWDAAKKREQIDQVADSLKQVNMPPEFIQSLGPDERKIVPPVANVATMRVEDFLTLYDSCKGIRAIDDRNALYPRRPVESDTLVPGERFAIVEDIAKSLGLVDASGKALDLPVEKKGVSMLTLMLDWKKPRQ